jgi:aspartate carbamoyltransferase regulatory subunit
VSNIIDISEKVRPAPKPETLTAVLHCEQCRCISPHNYSRTKEVKSRARLAREFELMYSCDMCGLERIWGNVVEPLR